MQASKLSNPDALSYEGAVRQAIAIQQYWHDRDERVEISVSMQEIDGIPAWVVRSNIINGWPCSRCNDEAKINVGTGVDACPVCTRKAEADYQAHIKGG
jgi:hypothetical protein